MDLSGPSIDVKLKEKKKKIKNEIGITPGLWHWNNSNQTSSSILNLIQNQN